jgi:hypothetical protein
MPRILAKDEGVSAMLQAARDQEQKNKSGAKNKLVPKKGFYTGLITGNLADF